MNTTIYSNLNNNHVSFQVKQDLLSLRYVPPPFIPPNPAAIPKTKVFLNDILHDIQTMPWKSASTRHLKRLYESKTEDFPELAEQYLSFIIETKLVLFKRAALHYRRRASPKRQGILKNTKTLIKMRLKQLIKVLIAKPTKSDFKQILEASAPVTHFLTTIQYYNNEHDDEGTVTETPEIELETGYSV